jgi:DNA-binding NtrC family response regulator
VRELENAIERAVVLGSTDTILPEDLPETLLDTTVAASAAPLKFYDALRETKKQMIVSAVEGAGGNYSEAAKLLGIHPNNLHRLMRNLGLKHSADK